MTGVVIRVVVADDHHIVRAGVRSVLERTDDIVVVGEADEGASAVAVTRAQRPDVVLMDLRMPGVDGLEATRRIRADGRLAEVRIIVLTIFDADDHVFDAIRHGASGFLLKDAEPDELRHAVRVVASGGAFLSPAVTGPVLAALAVTPQPHGAERLAALSSREQDVLVQVAQGLSNEAIATALGMSPATARTHVSRIMTKLHARDRTQLVVTAYETGLVTPGTTGAQNG